MKISFTVREFRNWNNLVETKDIGNSNKNAQLSLDRRATAYT